MYTIVLKHKKLPISLLQANGNKMKLLQVESFENTFGDKMNRRKPKLLFNDFKGLALLSKKFERTFFLHLHGS